MKTTLILNLISFFIFSSFVYASDLELKAAARNIKAKQNIEILTKLNGTKFPKESQQLLDLFFVAETAYVLGVESVYKGVNPFSPFILAILPDLSGESKGTSILEVMADNKGNYFFKLTASGADIHYIASNKVYIINLPKMNGAISWTYNNPFEYTVHYKGNSHHIEDLIK